MNDKRELPEPTRGDKIIGGMSRFVVSLMWAVLLAVVVFVFYLASRFYG